MIWIGLAIVVVTFYLSLLHSFWHLINSEISSSARSLWAQTAESPQPLMLSLSN